METSSDFSKFAQGRSVGFGTQFYEIFMRNLIYLKRNPRGLKGIFLNGVFSGLLQLALYWNIGKYTDALLNGTTEAQIGDRKRWIFNLNGLAFMIANNISFSSSSSVILQMTLQVPVFRRERANRMYSPTAYYWGRILSNLLIQLFYPLTAVLVVYFGLDIEVSI